LPPKILRTSLQQEKKDIAKFGSGRASSISQDFYCQIDGSMNSMNSVKEIQVNVTALGEARIETQREANDTLAKQYHTISCNAIHRSLSQGK
jgi:hypothetical protein